MSIFNTYAEAKAVMFHEFSKGNKGSIYAQGDSWVYKPVKFQASIAKPAPKPCKGNWDYTAIK